MSSILKRNCRTLVAWAGLFLVAIATTGCPGSGSNGGNGGGNAGPTGNPNLTYTVGGTVTGLTGSGLALQNNGGDNLAVKADGTFTFALALNDASAYSVSVLMSPSNPTQTCSVANGSGKITGTNVNSVVVTCTAPITSSYLTLGVFDTAHAFEPWVTDGTSGGTTLLKDINTNNSASTGDGDPKNFLQFKGLTYFIARSVEPLYFPDITPYNLWVTDGTPANTHQVLSKVIGIVEFNGALYLAHDDGISGYKLYKYDENSQATILVPGLDGYIVPPKYYWFVSNRYDFTPPEFVVAGNSLYFTAQKVSASGPYYAPDNELWKFDGTTSQAVPGITPNFPQGSTAPRYRVAQILANLGSQLVVAMYSEYVNNAATNYEVEIWVTDGIISTKTTGSPYLGPYGRGAVLNGAVYFLAADGVKTDSLFRTDLTTLKTEIVTTVFDKSLNPIPNLVNEYYGCDKLVAYNGKLYFYVGILQNGSLLRKLASSDGSIGGAVTMYPEIYQNAPVRVIGNNLYALGCCGSLYALDGATAGASLIVSLCVTNTSECGGFPYNVLLDFNGKAVFFASEQHYLDTTKTTFSPIMTNLYIYDGASTTLLKDNVCAAGMGSVCAPYG